MRVGAEENKSASSGDWLWAYVVDYWFNYSPPEWIRKGIFQDIGMACIGEPEGVW